MPDRLVETWGCKQRVELLMAPLDDRIELGQRRIRIARVAHDEMAPAARDEKALELVRVGGVEIERGDAGEAMVGGKPSGDPLQ